ncbi:cysteine--tRNA ligase [Alicyclobacillus cycloheptanicus]|uniref:Cysteine--tRNA ligase n=1 Tax=Alicyclobacillus cycloheptanicus TaxID=1457 RepID=A0ABT9XKS5_9BACL|nr:cysteine--tRNA ligase [Alicyclobacillus cycloheptanicus]MDQ0190383.1 cysteinyl-tRNA synthetase [Alicyclobacillus cycloheptanicus]WDM02626.1 cysteine--tRNA ligase [Alicyclobacillus cycloheptanicus]
MTVQLYNTMSRQKEPLIPIEPGKVRFYACGPTVYDLFHLGNARMFVVFDTVRRYLEYRGFQVRYVQNFTDVDDKIIQRANELGLDVRAVANRNIEEYFRDAKALGIRPATVHPRVTECIPEIIQYIDDLVKQGHAYAANGTVYFDTSSFEDYGKLSHQSTEEMQAGFRIDVSEEKRHPADFALWKAAKPGEEYWDSPWGPGRPGWHIECSVMNHLYLGDHIDIHGGGRDLMFPHHENEIAQSESHDGEPFARYWMHNGMIMINGEKMSKSLGNFVTARDLLLQHSARAIRFYLLSAHYRRPLNYTDEAMQQAEQSLDRIERCLLNLDHRRQSLEAAGELLHPEFVNHVPEAVLEAIDRVRAQFIEAMDDDFNTADALAAVFEGVREANAYLAGTPVSLEGIAQFEGLLLELTGVLGLQDALDEPLVVDGANDGAPAFGELTEADIEARLAERAEARKNRDFKRSDEIRDELAAAGVIIEDTPQGTRWRRK